MGWQWHQLGHMHIIWTLLETDNHASISPVVTLMNYSFASLKTLLDGFAKNAGSERVEVGRTLRLPREQYWVTMDTCPGSMHAPMKRLMLS